MVSLFWCLHLLISSDCLFNKLSPLHEAQLTFFGCVEMYAFPYYSPDNFDLKWLHFIAQYSLDSMSFS